MPVSFLVFGVRVTVGRESHIRKTQRSFGAEDTVDVCSRGKGDGGVFTGGGLEVVWGGEVVGEEERADYITSMSGRVSWAEAEG